MFRDLSKANNVEKVVIDEVRVAPAGDEQLLVIPVEVNGTVQVVFEYTVHDRMNRSSRVGSFQVMANRRESIASPVPAAHVTTDAYGEEPANLQLDVQSDGTNIIFLGTNATTQQEPIFFTAHAQILKIPPTPSPRLRVTITGMTGNQNLNGMGNGVHIVTPNYYYRSPSGGSAYSIIPYADGGGPYTASFSSGTQCEYWNNVVGGPTFSSYQGGFNMGIAVGSAKSLATARWHNGLSVQSTTASFNTGVTGFAQDRILSGTLVAGPVTITWEREPTDRPASWGNY